MSDLERGILILDYGSQYTLLIARRVRELGVYSEIWPCNDPRVADLKDVPALGIILSGGPNSVHIEGAPKLEANVLKLGIPVLGICYGMQAMAHALGGSVESSTRREYGRAELEISENAGLFRGFEKGAKTSVWMSHGDSVTQLPEGFNVVARTTAGVMGAIADEARHLYGVQFHPEVSHTQDGELFLENFVFGIVGCKQSWNMTDFIESSVTHIRETVGEEGQVICGLSGGARWRRRASPARPYP